MSSIDSDFERLQCGECGIVFYCPAAWVRARRDNGENGGAFKCPNGHPRAWKESELDRVRRERDIAKQQIARAEQEALEQRERAVKAEKETKRLRKRGAAGTCPCCQRTFSNMNTHMRKQHPDYVAGETAKIVPLKAVNK